MRFIRNRFAAKRPNRLGAKALGVVVVALSILPGAALATNGMYLIGQGISARGMGGVQVAYAQDALSAASNPATLMEIATGERGRRVDVGGDYFRPVRTTSVISGVDELRVRSGLEHFLFPNVGAVRRLGRDLAIGFTMIPAGGGSTFYPQNFFAWVADKNLDLDDPCADAEDVGLCEQSKGTLGVFLAQMHAGPSVAYRFLDSHAIGAQLIIGMQMFHAGGIGSFMGFRAEHPTDVNHLSNAGIEITYGAGARLGYYGKLFGDLIRLGAAYQTRVFMKAFDNYSQLFAEQGDLDNPAMISAGFALQPTDELVIGFEYSRTFYETVASIGNKGPNPRGGAIPEENKTGADQGFGFGWSNQDVYKVGVDWRLNRELNLRTGWNYGKSPINSKTEVLFNTLAPAVVQHHLTAGATYRASDSRYYTVSYIHAMQNRQVGPGMMGDSWAIEMYQDSLGFSATFQL